MNKKRWTTVDGLARLHQNDDNIATEYGGGDGGGGGMLERLEKKVEKLEKDISAMQIDLAVIKSNYATKADVESIRTGHQTMRAETVGEFGKVRTENQATRAELISKIADTEHRIAVKVDAHFKWILLAIVSPFIATAVQYAIAHWSK
ncbi:hypothetical protein LQ759_18905 [Serratia marcescens]|uniref:hypothetical protein n=2 Tax=Serratia TaxID=613 RepID=UPI001F2AD93B|nr:MULTISPECIES: hypothetical protein [Serratia]MCF1611959.1 hypothetical protein [Serratia marcescens]MDI6973404.1 hypothetical protein [Serratia sp. Se-RSBMAAmG]MDI9262373.1 hypothetical protein [Serratia sp. PF2-63]MDI9271225.1 hypothetical protein [Serratia sp. PF-27]